MATVSSLQESLQGIGSRLKAENEAQSRDRMNTNLTLDFSRERAGSERRPRPSPFADFPSRPNTVSARPRAERPRIEPLLFQIPKQQQDSPELNAHVREISRKKGLISVNGQQYKSTIEDMKYISELGNGTSGSVVKMLHKPSEKFIAVKQMHRSGNLEEAKRVFFDLEVVLKSHDCPYIVQCLGCFLTDTDVWICMELMATCLDKLMKKYKQPFPEPIIGKIAVGTVKALHYLKESHGVIHRDVKPSNILLDERGNIKLCDFGISGRLVDSKANTRSAGCAAYMAPERIDPPDPSKPDYDIRADVWSLGITLVELATGQFPYKDCRTDFEVLTKVLQDAPPCLPSDKGFSSDFRDFVKDCLVKDYKNRPKYKKLLEYPFIKKYEKESVDVSKWFTEVTRTIENRSKTWPQTTFSSPHFSRASRTNSRAPSSVPVTETPPTPPPIAPRRRSRTPDTRSQERFQHLSAKPPTQPNHSKVPASPILGRTSRQHPSRAHSASPVPESLLATIPNHQYGVPSPAALYNYSPKPYCSSSQAYSNPYSPALPPRAHNSSGLHSTTLGEISKGGTSYSTPYSAPSSSIITTPQILRKTPEPVRFNPEPWAPRGRFTQPSHHHFRSLSHDFSSSNSSSSSPRVSSSRYPSSYLPHVSPLVSRRLVENRTVAGEPNTPPRLSSSSSNGSGPSSLPTTFSSPHYRYTQEVLYNSRPYYTPEPQRRIFPRLGNP